MPDSPQVWPPGRLGLLKFLLQPRRSALGIFYFLLFPFPRFHLLNIVRVHTEHVGTLAWLLPPTKISTLSTFHILCWRIKESNIGILSDLPLTEPSRTTEKGAESQYRCFLLKHFSKFISFEEVLDSKRNISRKHPYMFSSGMGPYLDYRDDLGVEGGSIC